MAPMCKFLKALFLGMVFRSKWRRSSKSRGRNRKGGQIFSVGDYSQDLSRFPADDKIYDDDIFGVLGTVGTIGTVFWGQLADGSEIAVKRLDTSKMKGVKEFSAQAKLLGSIRHKNILTLRGYCAEGKERLLVYDYMINLSLHTHLHGSLSSSLVLDWSRRMTIAIGAADGLMHLHHKTSPPTVHGDIKSNNILLDKNFEAKWADFGLIKLMQEAWLMKGGSEGMATYFAPEYSKGSARSLSGDVFGFGILLLELISGKKPLEKMGHTRSPCGSGPSPSSRRAASTSSWTPGSRATTLATSSTSSSMSPPCAPSPCPAAASPWSRPWTCSAAAMCAATAATTSPTAITTWSLDQIASDRVCAFSACLLLCESVPRSSPSKFEALTVDSIVSTSVHRNRRIDEENGMERKGKERRMMMETCVYWCHDI